MRWTFKTRTILLFSTITILLVAAMSRLSYVTARQIYLDQLSDHIRLMTSMVGQQIDPRQLPFLNPAGGPSLAGSYYGEFLTKQKSTTGAHSLALFSNSLITVASSEKDALLGIREPILLLHRQEIASLTPGQALSTVPFRGQDGLWYLWCFYKVTDEYHLAIQERADRVAELEDLAWIFWALGFLGIALTIGGGFLLARTINKPIQQLVAFSKELGEGRWQAALPDGVKGELLILVQAMDRMRNQLVERHAEKETLLAQIAHEIRNPLGSLELLAGLVREDLVKNRLDGRYAETMLTEIAGLKSLLTDYLNYGRPGRVQTETVDIAVLIAEARILNASLLTEKKIDFQFHGESETIRFDPYHLRQIITNLLANAAEAVDEHGMIAIRAYRQNGATCIDVIDNGSGVPEADRMKIFEPFFTTHKGGTGLGLAICKKLCSENNAAITFRSNPDGGSIFTIRQ